MKPILYIVCWIAGAVVLSVIFVTVVPRQSSWAGASGGMLIVGPVIGHLVADFIWNQITAAGQRAELERWKREQEEAKREAQRQQELADLDAYKSQQVAYFTSLVDLGSRSFALFEAMPNHLMSTEELLDQAELDFMDGAFAPFWDYVERAATQLGHFDDNVRTITANAEAHTTITKRYKGSPPSFPIVLDSITGMTAVKSTSDRMKAIVRNAQRNFQFATIFEQRKTNQLLVAGFTNLAQALDGMGRRIESSIDKLGEQISDMSSTLETTIQDLGTNLNSTLSSLHESSTESFSKQFSGIHASMQNESERRMVRHREVLEMLDNIQRRRKPDGARVKDFWTKPV